LEKHCNVGGSKLPETSDSIYQTTRCNIPEGRQLNSGFIVNGNDSLNILLFVDCKIIIQKAEVGLRVILIMEALNFTERPVIIHQTSRFNIPKDKLAMRN
jgi:hypothetical protein